MCFHKMCLLGKWLPAPPEFCCAFCWGERIELGSLGMVVHTCSPSPWMVKDSEFLASLGYVVIPYQKTPGLQEREGKEGNKSVIHQESRQRVNC